MAKTKARKIKKYQAARFGIKIAMRPFSAYERSLLTSIKMNEKADRPDTMTLVLQDPDFVFIEDNLFTEDAYTHGWLRWEGDTYSHHHVGRISTIDIDFNASGAPVLTVVSMDARSQEMNREKKKRTWENVTSAEIVTAICSEYGIPVALDTTYIFVKQETIVQSDQTDLDFLHSLAESEREPFLFKVRDDHAYFTRKGYAVVRNTFTYRTRPWEIMSFSPQVNKEIKKFEYTEEDIDPVTQAVVEGLARNDNVPRRIEGKPVEVSRSTVPKTSKEIQKALNFTKKVEKRRKNSAKSVSRKALQELQRPTLNPKKFGK